MTTAHDVAVIGGGFAGCAAALRLARQGLRPILIEYKFHLGGRSTSYSVRDWPATLDNGQHVLLGCCTEARKFLDEVRAASAVEWHSSMAVADPAGRIRKLRTWPLVAPFHLVPFLASYPGLSAAERARIVWGILRMTTASRVNGAWGETAEEFGQTENIQRKFWDPFLVSALNSEPAHSATSYVRHIVMDAFIRDRNGLLIGIPRVPLLKLFSDHVRPELERSGAILKAGKRVLRMSLDPHGFVIHLHDQSAMTAKKVILATAPLASKQILEESTGLEKTAGPISKLLGGSPIISIHLLYDRILTHLPFCMVQGKMIQWIFNKGVYEGQQHLQAVISAADHEAGQSQMELVVSADAEIRAVLGVQGNLVRGVAFIEKDATFPPRPGLIRPTARSTHPDLYLAGDYVDSGWPATIESAIRSGNAAAAAVMGATSDRVPNS